MNPNDPNDKIVVLQNTETPVVALTRIKRINTYEVIDSDLDALDQIVADENRAIGFTSISFGVFTSTIIPFVVSPPPETAAKAWAVYISVSLVSGIATFWFGIVWLQARKRRPRLLDRIRSTTTVESKQTISPKTQ